MAYFAKCIFPDYFVVVRKNDMRETYLGTLAADLTSEQASALAVALNVLFAEQGLKWFARLKKD